MSYEDLAGDDGLRINMVVRIGDEYWADALPDADPGSLITAAKCGFLRNVKIPIPDVNPLQASYTVSSVSFELVDHGGEVSDWYGANNNALYGVDCEIYVGVLGQSQSFPADYKLQATCRIRKPEKLANSWLFSAVDVLEKALKSSFKTRTKLSADVDDNDTTFPVESTTGFPSSGYFRIDDELCSYSGVTATTFTGVTRAAVGGVAEEHDEDTEVQLVARVEGNAVELALQLLVSAGGGGSYDLLDDGAGISEDLVDVEAFEALVDDFVSFPFLIWPSDLDKTLDYIQTNLLFPLGIRILTKDGLISCAKLEDFEAVLSAQTIDETIVEKTPALEIDADQIVNEFEVKYNWNAGSKLFGTRTIYTNSYSETKYGTRRFNKVIEIQAVITNGYVLLSSMMNKYLKRYGDPVATIEATAKRSASLNTPGSIVRLVHDKVPQPGAGLGHDAYMEVMKTDKDIKAGKVRLQLQYTSYSGYKLGLICPSPLIVSAASQKIFTLPSGYGKFYRAGYALRLWEGTAYLADAVNLVESVSGDTVTMVNNWSTTLTNSIRVKFADYDDCSEEQRRLFCFIAGNEGGASVVADDGAGNDQQVVAGSDDVVVYQIDHADEFSDGKAPFQIVP